VARGPEPSESLWLPPLDAQLINPKKEKIPTPVDEYGLVKVGELIDNVKATVDPSYEWRQSFPDRHHFYWIAANFPDIREEGVTNPREFRELSTHKGYMFREFHNWIHEATIPPARPSEEVMRQVIDGYLATIGLYSAARTIVGVERRIKREIDREKHLEKIQQSFAKLAVVPEALQVAKVEPHADLHTIANTLGKVVGSKFLVLKRRAAA